MRPETVHKVACVNFGGIGDEILFSPVIEEIRACLPQAHVTLIMETRSRSVMEVLPGVDAVRTLDLRKEPRWRTFLRLWQMLFRQDFDVVVSSGSSPWIPLLLFASGIPVRVGFRTGLLSRLLLTVAAPLAPRHDRKGYAAEMYFALARSFLTWLMKSRYHPMDPVLPHLREPLLDDRMWAKSILKPDDPARKILIHPGVSAVSVQKNILKSWPPVYWAEIIQWLVREGHQVYLSGGPDDQHAVGEITRLLPARLPGFINLYGRTKNLRQLAALILECDLLLCVDSSPMHLAVGYQKPLLALFGPTDEKKLLPASDKRFQSVSLPDLSCRPCLWDVRNECCDNPVCLGIPPALVMERIGQMLVAARI